MRVQCEQRIEGERDVSCPGELTAALLEDLLVSPWFVTRSAGKNAVTSVSVNRVVTGVWCLRFEDSGQRLADVHVHLPVRAQRINDELRQCGYTVTDRKTGQAAVRLPRR